MNALSGPDEHQRKQVIYREAQPDMQALVYSAGECVGGLLALPTVVHFGGLGGFVHSLTAIDEAPASKALSVVLFSAEPAGSTIEDGAAIVIGAGDAAKILGVIAIVADDYFPVGSGLAVASLGAIGLAFETGEGKGLYAAALANEAATYQASDDLTLRFGLVQG